jgi:NADP-dependent 3-hydroxy acid dehydrogenase YdfG
LTAPALPIHYHVHGPATPPRSILITGVSSGIGAALARRYAGPGVRLALGGRDSARLAAVAVACRQAGAEAAERCVEVTDRRSMAPGSRTPTGRHRSTW